MLLVAGTLQWDKLRKTGLLNNLARWFDFVGGVPAVKQTVERYDPRQLRKNAVADGKGPSTSSRGGGAPCVPIPAWLILGLVMLLHVRPAPRTSTPLSPSFALTQATRGPSSRLKTRRWARSSQGSHPSRLATCTSGTPRLQCSISTLQKCITASCSSVSMTPILARYSRHAFDQPTVWCCAIVPS